jgi:hypothetical protein
MPEYFPELPNLLLKLVLGLFLGLTAGKNFLLPVLKALRFTLPLGNRLQELRILKDTSQLRKVRGGLLFDLVFLAVLGWFSYAFAGLGFYAFLGTVGVSVGIFFFDRRAGHFVFQGLLDHNRPHIDAIGLAANWCEILKIFSCGDFIVLLPMPGLDALFACLLVQGGVVTKSRASCQKSRSLPRSKCCS